jgi:hypothetical protein
MAALPERVVFLLRRNAQPDCECTPSLLLTHSARQAAGRHADRIVTAFALADPRARRVELEREALLDVAQRDHHFGIGDPAGKAAAFRQPLAEQKPLDTLELPLIRGNLPPFPAGRRGALELQLRGDRAVI